MSVKVSIKPLESHLHCVFCKSEGDVVFCWNCNTPHHKECMFYGCIVCGEKKYTKTGKVCILQHNGLLKRKLLYKKLEYAYMVGFGATIIGAIWSAGSLLLTTAFLILSVIFLLLFMFYCNESINIEATRRRKIH